MHVVLELPGTGKPASGLRGCSGCKLPLMFVCDPGSLMQDEVIQQRARGGKDEEGGGRLAQSPQRCRTRRVDRP